MKKRLFLIAVVCVASFTSRAQELGSDNGTRNAPIIERNVRVDRFVTPTTKARTIVDANYRVDLLGLTRQRVATDPEYDAYLALRTNNPAAITFITGNDTVTADDLIRQGTPGELVLRAPADIRPVTGRVRLSDVRIYYRLDGVPGYPGFASFTLGFTAYDNGAVGWLNGQKITSGSATQEVDFIQLAGGTVWLDGDTAAEYASARASLDSVIPGQPLYSGIMIGNTVYADPAESQVFRFSFVDPVNQPGLVRVDVFPTGSATGNVTIERGLPDGDGEAMWNALGPIAIGQNWQMPINEEGFVSSAFRARR